MAINNDWGRRGVRLIRSNLPPNDQAALWHGPGGAASEAALKWAEGTPSGFRWSNISGPGALMGAEITVATRH